MKIQVTEYVRPNAQKVIRQFEISDSLAEKVRQITSLGLRFTLEDCGIRTSVCIEDPTYGDFDIQLRRPERVVVAFEEMIGNFDQIQFDSWRMDQGRENCEA